MYSGTFLIWTPLLSRQPKFVIPLVSFELDESTSLVTDISEILWHDFPDKRGSLYSVCIRIVHYEK